MLHHFRLNGVILAIGVVARLNTIISHIEAASQKQYMKNSSKEWREMMTNALNELTSILKDEAAVSAFELHSSGLIQTLLNLFSTAAPPNVSENTKLTRKLVKFQKQRVEIFRECFSVTGEEEGEAELETSPANEMVRKLVSVLESIEKLPVYLYDNSQSGYGLQILTRRLRFRLERAPGENSLIDRTGCTLKMEPLSSLKQLERFLLKMVAKQWFDHDRSTFSFIKKIRENAPLTFSHHQDFDENGILYWIGTNGRTAYEWVNPAQYHLVVVTSSEGRSLPYGKLEDILSRESAPLNCHTNDDKRAWFALDLGMWVVPTAYTLRHARGYGRSALRSWQFQVHFS